MIDGKSGSASSSGSRASSSSSLQSLRASSGSCSGSRLRNTLDLSCVLAKENLQPELGLTRHLQTTSANWFCCSCSVMKRKGGELQLVGTSW